MNDVLHFSISDNGFYSSLPQLMKLIMALLTGALNDWLIISSYLTITNGRKLFVAIGMYNSFQFFAHPLTIIRNHLRWTKKRCHTERHICYVCCAYVHQDQMFNVYNVWITFQRQYLRVSSFWPLRMQSVTMCMWWCILRSQLHSKVCPELQLIHWT